MTSSLSTALSTHAHHTGSRRSTSAHMRASADARAGAPSAARLSKPPAMDGELADAAVDGENDLRDDPRAHVEHLTLRGEANARLGHEQVPTGGKVDVKASAGIGRNRRNRFPR